MGTANTTSSEQASADGGHDDDGGENVLVLTNSMDGDADDYCVEHISSSHGRFSLNVLLVSLDETPDRRFDAVVRRLGGQPSNVGIICCDRTRSAAASQPTQGPGVGGGPWIATVSSPGDLTGLGVRIEQALSGWADAAEPVEICFHSLTTLCQYVDHRTAFRFCHALTRHIDSAGASSHFHLDPSAVDERTVSTLSALFDRVEDRT